MARKHCGFLLPPSRRKSKRGELFFKPQAEDHCDDFNVRTVLGSQSVALFRLLVIATWRHILKRDYFTSLLHCHAQTGCGRRKKSFKWTRRFHSLHYGISDFPWQNKRYQIFRAPVSVAIGYKPTPGPKCPSKHRVGMTLAEYSAQARQQGCWRSQRQRLEGSASPQMSQCWMELVHKLLSPDSNGVQAAAGGKQNFLEVSCSPSRAGLGKISALPFTSIPMGIQGSFTRGRSQQSCSFKFGSVCFVLRWYVRSQFQACRLCSPSLLFLHGLLICALLTEAAEVLMTTEMKIQKFHSFSHFINPSRAWALPKFNHRR